MRPTSLRYSQSRLQHNHGRNPLSRTQPAVQTNRASSPDSFFIDVNLTDGKTYQIALYNLDFDWSIRSQTINVRDASTNAILDSRTLAAGATFHNGEYLVWNVQGHVKYEIIRTGAFNAVINGIFFDTLTSSPAGSLSIPTYHATLANDGQNLKETILTPTNVSSARFGKIVSVPLTGDVYTQPVFQSGVNVPGKGTHDIVFTVTNLGVAYAIDARAGSDQGGSYPQAAK